MGGIGGDRSVTFFCHYVESFLSPVPMERKKSRVWKREIQGKKKWKTLSLTAYSNTDGSVSISHFKSSCKAWEFSYPVS